MRGLVEPSFAEGTVINHRDYFKNGDLVISSAVNITETEVFTDDDRQIAYDYLVVATGHTELLPKTRTERLDQYKEGNFYPMLKSYLEAEKKNEQRNI